MLKQGSMFQGSLSLALPRVSRRVASARAVAQRAVTVVFAMMLTVGFVFTGGVSVANADMHTAANGTTSVLRVTRTATTMTPAVVALAGGEPDVPLVVQWNVGGDTAPVTVVGNRAEHRYNKPGTYRVRVTLDGGLLANTTVTVTKGAGALFNAGKVPATNRGATTATMAAFTPSWWTREVTMMTRVATPNRTTVAGLTRIGPTERDNGTTRYRATYAPCQTVTWYWDHTSETRDRDGLYRLVPHALDMLSEHTGLVFVETSVPRQADITFMWGEPDWDQRRGEDVLGNARVYAITNQAFIKFSPTHEVMTNAYNGFHMYTRPDGEQVVGNGAVIIHEAMHALGIDHNEHDGSIMNPYITSPLLSEGDLAELAALYPRDHCPA